MTSHPLEGRRVDLAEYHSLIRDGALGEDDRVELLDGTITAMTPQGVAHARIICELTDHFAYAIRGAAKLRVQLPLTLPDHSEPEPDVAIVSLDEARRRDGHPRSALLVVEVARDSLTKDRHVKGAIYARAGVTEYWIVDVDACAIEVHRDPDRDAARYGSVRRFVAPDSLAPVAFPRASLALKDLFES